MKKILTVALASILCLAMLAAVIVPLGYDRLTPPVTFDDLALTVGNQTFDTTIPNYFLDFSDPEIEYQMLGEYNMSHSYVTSDGGYVKMTATNGDPYTYLEAPKCDSMDIQYISIVYRTNLSGGGEIYVSKSSGEQMGQDTMVSWNSYIGDGQWNMTVVDLSKLCKSGVTFTNFRIDPYHSQQSGAAIDIKCIAGFATQADAEGFDFDEYKNYLVAEEEGDINVEWDAPKYKDKTFTVDDDYAGTLKYTNNGDGTVTVKYQVNGEERSYTFVDDPIYTSGGYAAKDDANRVLPTSKDTGVIGEKGEHYVGIFYFLWMGEHGDTGVYNLEEIKNKYGENAKNADYIDPATRKKIYSDVGAHHWFAEPLYGYYYSNDEWVMRKHIEQLTNAGIDFLYLDTTNAYTYAHNVVKLMQIIHEYNEMGYNPPKLVFYTNTKSIKTMNELYNNVYMANMYPDTWFYVDGKPCIVGDSTQATSRSELETLEKLKSYFTIKESQWPNDYQNPLKDNAWPWMSFDWPQKVHNDANGNPSAISVSIAQHSGSVCFSHSSLYFSAAGEQNRGRSYAGQRTLSEYRMKYDKNNELSYLGLNFQQQWNVAIKEDVKFVLVTGWNEWVAQRQIDKNNPSQVIFIDTSSVEFSRDAEMMRGGYFDNYYMQIIYNIQKLKGSAPIIVQDARNPINVTGDFDQWNDVVINYQDGEGDIANRNGSGFGNQRYTDKSGRNDIVNAKITNDTKYAYFYVETKDIMKKYDGKSSWMQLFVNTDNDPDSGWYGYDYIINYNAKSDYLTTVAKHSGKDGEYAFKAIGSVTYKVEGNKMMIEVPLEMLGYSDYRQVYMEFKWADADEEVQFNEMEDFYCFGDAAPMGRLNYIYQTYIPGESEFEDLNKPGSDTSTEDETGNISEITTDVAGTQAPDEVTTNESDANSGNGDGGKKKGCKSAVSGVCSVAVAILCAGYYSKKRKEE